MSFSDQFLRRRFSAFGSYAQLTLNDVTTGQLKACVQATLSNGWSAHQVAVEWATGALGLLALLSAIWYSQSSDALAPYRLFDLFYLFQWAASTALLDLNYSSVYIAFATNFSWALGLFPASATSPIQLSINNMRHLTGGNMADATSGSAVALVNRKLSPYNAVVTSLADYQTISLARETLMALGNLKTPDLLFPAFFSSVQELDNAGIVQLVTASSSNVLQAGVPIYVGYVGIATANAFMTIFFVALILLAILTAVLVLGYGIVVLISRQTKYTSFLRRRELYPAFACAWLLRVVSTESLSDLEIFVYASELVFHRNNPCQHFCAVSVDTQRLLAVNLAVGSALSRGARLSLFFHLPRRPRRIPCHTVCTVHAA